MLRWLAVLGVGFLMTMGVLQMMAYDTPIEQGEDSSLFLPMVQRPHPLPAINFFEANVAMADPGDTIELSWDTTDAVSVTIYHLLPTGQLGKFWHVAMSGTMTYTIDVNSRNQTDFLIFASNVVGQWVSASVHIGLTCPDPWFFEPAPAICSVTAALISNGAEQHFEHGVMLWVEEEDRIYVLFDDGQTTTAWGAYTDEWEEGMPEIDPTIVPPPGYYQPRRGFGLVWREQMSGGILVRDRLGWAVDIESEYETAVQRTSSSYSDTYVRAADGNVWRLVTEFSDWEKIIVEPEAVIGEP
jgi:hypothetical protein